MSGINEFDSNTIIIIDSDEEQELMDVQESAALENATCVTSCSSGFRRSVPAGNEATTSTTSTRDCEAEGTGTVNSVLRAGDSSTNVSLPCTCLGCSNFSIPHQPLELPQFKVAVSHSSKPGHTSKVVKQCSRTIQPSWFKRYSWITVCANRHKVFCRVCCLAKQQKLLSVSVLRSSPFINEGFGSWNKALERFDVHEKSQMHREAVERLACKASSVDLGVMMNARSSVDQEFHRNMLFKLLRAIRFLGKQGLPLRGHNENAEAFQGNLYQLLLLQAEECPRMISWLQQRDYISPTITDEIVNSMGQMILRGILKDIKSVQWFSIIADEATDISGTEQLSLSIR